MTEVYNTSISNAVTKTVMELFDAMLSLDVAPADEVTDKALDGSRIVGAVHYTGQIVGVVSVHVGKAFARKIAGAMLGVAREDALDDAAIKDVIGEITNMISGNLSTELVNSGQGCAISAPAITSGPDFDIDPLDVDLTKHLVFKHEESNMVVQLCLKEESVGEEFLIKSDGLTPEAIMEKVNSVDVATTIINSVIDVFYTMLSMEVERLEELPAGFRAQQHIVGSVSFAGDLDGLFNLQVNEDFAQVMTASMLGMEIEEIEGDEEVHDVLREMSNIIGGTLKSSFVDVGLTCQLTIPSITIGKDFRIESLKINKMEQFVFKYEDWLIIVEAGIKKDEIATEEKTQRAEAVPDEQGPKAPEA
ncbi:MAG: chemotaxis protein CheX, partial [Desulfobacteraceae bacterium]|nr:chemotaxis protein CheX [Desulfobacteraceae bacterium]